MPLISTRGAASAQGFGEFATSSEKLYIESCFSTYLYTGNGSTQTITNGIDLAGEGGLVWIKDRTNVNNNVLTNTDSGLTKFLYSNSTSAELTSPNGIQSVSSNGFVIGPAGAMNGSGAALASWTFRKQAKFFDVVTFSGTGATQTIAHNLGAVPGCILVKRTSGGTQDWYVYHRSAGAGTAYANLNTNDSFQTSSNTWSNTNATATHFTVGAFMLSGSTYVAYLFAHNAGGFGLTGTDNVISCGSYTGNGSTTGPLINLGWEPQWLLVKQSSISGAGWYLIDTMRGATSSGTDAVLFANTSGAETSDSRIAINATGFQPIQAGGELNASGETCIYIAIRRGPMKVPTSGTSVFSVGTRAGSASVAKTNSNVLTDLAVIKRYTSAAEYWAWTPRLVGNQTLQSNSTDAELVGAMATNPWDTMTGAFCAASNGATNTSTLVDYSFQRAPGFFDIVCYSGTGSGTQQTINHNLGVAPEIIIYKSRNNSGGVSWYNWLVLTSPGWGNYQLLLNTAGARSGPGAGWPTTAPSSAQFYANAEINQSANTYVAYLFATVAGVSKVGSYTGSGTTKQIDCGFTAGARFVLIKRTDSTGDWYVYDSARGIVAGNDPYLFLNSTAAEVTSTDYVDTYSAGFELSSTAPAGLNANGGTYIFLAIA